MTQNNTLNLVEQGLSDFLDSHRLPTAWIGSAQRWFNPLADQLATQIRRAATPLIIGINGSQGSGKSTLGDYLVWCLNTRHQLAGISLSLDDFYLTHNERSQLASDVHPLLATRGVPGTHDLALAHDTLDALCADSGECTLPRFDKAIDDRSPNPEWIRLPVRFIILEGWCLGIPAQAEKQLESAVNTLERDEDPEGIWRHYVNSALNSDYPKLFNRVNQWVMLQAPSFDCVFNWRLEQEQKLEQTMPDTHHKRSMNSQQIARFIQHYQRLTEQALATLPHQVQHLFILNEQRQVCGYQQPVEIL